MKWLLQHRRCYSYLLAALMIVAAGTRLHLTHNEGVEASVWKLSVRANHDYEQLNCNCPICHAEDFIATKAESFEYHAFISTLSYEFAVYRTAAANNIVVLSSLRGPPCLS